jgi:hypothetical protein
MEDTNIPDGRDVGGYPIGFVGQLISFIFLSKLITMHATLIHFYKFWADPLTHKVGDLHPYMTATRSQTN